MTQEICNFCLKKINEVEFIIKKNDHTAICGECVDIASAVLQDKRELVKNDRVSDINKTRGQHDLSNFKVDEKLARSLGRDTLFKYGVIPSSTRSILLTFAGYDLDNLHKKNPTLFEIICSLQEFSEKSVCTTYIFATQEEIENKIKKIF